MEKQVGGCSHDVIFEAAASVCWYNTKEYKNNTKVKSYTCIRLAMFIQVDVKDWFTQIKNTNTQPHMIYVWNCGHVIKKDTKITLFMLKKLSDN